MFLHGWGMKSSDYVNLFTRMNLPYQVILPNAPFPDANDDGIKNFEKTSWFSHMMIQGYEEGSLVHRNAKMLEKIVEEEDVQILGGFSMGGNFATFMALHYLERRMLATFSLSAIVYDMQKFPPRHTIPLFMYMGTKDEWHTTDQVYRRLVDRLPPGWPHEFHMEEDHTHRISRRETEALKNFLRKHVPEPNL